MLTYQLVINAAQLMLILTSCDC